MTTLGARILRVEDGEVHIEPPLSNGVTQQLGYVHAGAITSVLDSACGYAALTKAPADHEVVTAEFKINLMRPAIGERFIAIGKVNNAGKMLTVCTDTVKSVAQHDTRKVVALMQATVVNVKR